MYAMLTGCLPYTVEPFNITALHAKMLENKMNPIPDHLSESKQHVQPLYLYYQGLYISRICSPIINAKEFLL